MSGQDSFLEEFWSIVSGFKRELKILFAIVLSLMTITVVSMALADQDQGTYVISVVTLVILGATAFLIALCLWYIR